jgi:hypothetical protein
VVDDNTAILATGNADLLNKIKKVIKLSLIPNCSKKILITDSPKDISIELRCLPALELHILIPESYPSNSGPMFLMTTPFYEPFKNFLYEKLCEKWNEGSIVVYECVYFV